MKHFFPLLFVVLIAFVSCNKPEATPSYLRVEPFTVTALGGNAWQKVTDGWVYVNGELIGGFSLPVEIPVLAEGASEVQVFPGVKVNGLKDSPGLYPFLKRYVSQVQLVAGATATVNPVTDYESTAIFPWSEQAGSFDASSNVLIENYDANAQNSFEITTVAGMQGKGLLLQADTANAIMEIVTPATALPNAGDRAVWLEMNYSNEAPFSMLLLGIQSDGYVESSSVYLFNTTGLGNWNKIYINLTDYLVGLKRPQYRLLFRLPLPVGSNGQYSVLSSKVFIDNIRLVHF